MSKEKYLANIDRVLQETLSKTSSNLGDKNKIAYSEDLEKKGAFLKIAFDVYRVPEDPYNGLWTLEDHNGQPYLVRASTPQQPDAGNWTAISNQDRDNITLSYKKYPIARFSSDKYGFTSNDIISFKLALLENVNNDEDFVKEVLLEQPEAKRLAVLSQFPELQKVIRG